MLERSQKTGWIAGVESGLVDVLCHDGAGPDHDMITNRHRKNGRVSTDANPIADPGGFPLASIGSGGTAFFKKIVDEHGPVRNKTIVSHHNELTNKCVRLDPASFTDTHPFLNLNERSHKGLITNSTPVEVNRLYDYDILTEVDTNYSGYAQIGLIHSSLSLFP